MANLKLDWCSHEAAKYAVEHWHYSECMPAGKTVKIGVWEDGQFIGCVIFSRGASNELGTAYGLKQIEVCELTRVALNKHINNVSKIGSIAIKMLRQSNVGLRLIVSFADPLQGHLGSVYQAMNWLYTGQTERYREIVVNGVGMHRRSAGAKFTSYSLGHLHKYIDPKAHYTYQEGKHRYLYPLDDAMRAQVQPLAKPYPKRAPIA